MVIRSEAARERRRIQARSRVRAPRSEAAREIARIRSKDWYNRNADKKIAQVAVWHKANREKVNAGYRRRAAEYLIAHPRPIRHCIIIGCMVVLKSHQRKYCADDWKFFKKNPPRDSRRKK